MKPVSQAGRVVLLVGSLFSLIFLVGCGAPPTSSPTFMPVAQLTPDQGIRSLLTIRLASVERNPTDPALWVELGRGFEASSLFDQAVRSYRHALELDPDAAARERLAATYLRLGDDDRALETLAELVKRVSKDDSGNLAVAYWRAGEVKFRLGRLEEAVSDLRQSVSLNERFGPSKLALARALLEAGEFDQSRTMAATVASAPAGTDWERSLARLSAQLGIPESPGMPEGESYWRDPWERDLEADGVGFAARSRRSEALLTQGDFHTALVALEELLREQPQNPTVISNLAGAYLGTNQAPRAIELLIGGAGQLPEQPAALVNLAAAYLAIGDPEQAWQAARKARRLNPTLGQAFALEGAALVRGGQAARALGPLQRAQQLAPADMRVKGELARAFMGEGRFAAALDLFRVLVAREPRRGDLHLAIATCAMELGLVEEAQRSLGRAEQLGVPESEQLNAAKRRLQQEARK